MEQMQVLHTHTHKNHLYDSMQNKTYKGILRVPDFI